VAVINEAFAPKFFKNEDPIGKFFGQSGMGASRQCEIVGIAHDARYLDFGLGRPVGRFFSQRRINGCQPGLTFLQDIVLVTRPGACLPFAQVRQAMASVDPGMPIISIRALKEQLSSLSSGGTHTSHL
jgi:hypothetical protein